MIHENTHALNEYRKYYPERKKYYWKVKKASKVKWVIQGRNVKMKKRYDGLEKYKMKDKSIWDAQYAIREI